MSSTSRGKNVENDDFYATPIWVTKAILPYLPTDGAVLDPCCGEGAILDAVQHRRPTFGIELDATRTMTARTIHAVQHADALTVPWPDAPAVIMNPPFSLAEKFVRKGIEHVFAGVPSRDADLPLLGRAAKKKDRVCAVLLRLAFLESASRIPLHRAYPADVYSLAYRPSFAAVVSCSRGKKVCKWSLTLPLRADRPSTCTLCGAPTKTNTSDSCAYAWFVWGPGRGGRIKVLEDAPPNVRHRGPKQPVIEPEHVEAISEMVCPRPESGHGAGDEFGGEDFPSAVAS